MQTREQCPVSDRKITRANEATEPPVELVDGVWHIRDHEAARQMLRVRDGFVQSGFNAEFLVTQLQGMRLPILYGDGAEHRRQRTAVARFFAPKTVADRYRDLMERTADDLVASMCGRPSSDFSTVASEYSVEIASHVLGLDTSRLSATCKRLYALFHVPHLPIGHRLSLGDLFRLRVVANVRLLRFWLADVRPAVKARRARRERDIISHLLDSGYSEPEILTECVTYGAAGMITTREFLQVALWHLLGDDALRDRFVAADSAGKQAVLLEILRLEPVVGHLHRRAIEDVEVVAAGAVHRISKGDRLDIYLRAVNTDPQFFAPEPERLCVGRSVPSGARPEGMSFGDGAHRCPGNSLAMLESEILLGRLLDCDVRIVQEPTLGWEEIVAGYELTDFRIRVRQR